MGVFGAELVLATLACLQQQWLGDLVAGLLDVQHGKFMDGLKLPPGPGFPASAKSL